MIEKDKDKETKDVTGAILEFRGAAGGAESAIFASEMIVFFQTFMRSKGFQVSSENIDSKIPRLKAKGDNVYDYMKHEAGVHKVIRVPETEARGRLHSSTMTLMILPDTPFNFNLDERELKFEYARSQGPGGQHVNSTDSACRVLHKPTGIQVFIQEYRYQYQNKDKAFEIIKEKVYQHEFDIKQSAMNAERKSKMGTGDRSEKIRTYNFQQDRITDHRIGKTVYGMKKYLNSGLIFEECIEEMIELENDQRKKDLINRIMDLGVSK